MGVGSQFCLPYRQRYQVHSRETSDLHKENNAESIQQCAEIALKQNEPGLIIANSIAAL